MIKYIADDPRYDSLILRITHYSLNPGRKSFETLTKRKIFTIANFTHFHRKSFPAGRLTVRKNGSIITAEDIFDHRIRSVHVNVFLSAVWFENMIECINFPLKEEKKQKNWLKIIRTYFFLFHGHFIQKIDPKSQEKGNFSVPVQKICRNYNKTYHFLFHSFLRFCFFCVRCWNRRLVQFYFSRFTKKESIQLSVFDCGTEKANSWREICSTIVVFLNSNKKNFSTK